MEAAEIEKLNLIELNKKLGEAEKKGDAGFFKNNLSDALRFRRANGTIVDKDIFLDDLIKPGNTFTELSIVKDEKGKDQIGVQIFDNLAIVALDIKAEGTRCGMPFEGEFRNVRIFLKEAGKQPEWQLHFWFNTRIDK